ncbi:glycosyltransferase family 2 protein [Polaribacter sp. AHE13PA]|uniref:glycosyltransferase family 2 protein n=1 Tax=Polaribacter sp. AHE13PA TaxID=2745562 RepID=UPI001C4EDEFD|nr:glycosyltransferase family 2 protein [Polaribacter sp. AHE13PA]QXP67474.1 glycosyltransferase family 2 protein [Polaribacter sp. AHE13PA]
MEKEKEISVVIPLYRCANTIEELCIRLIKVFSKLNISYEIILINDGSPENDWEVALKLSEGNNNIKSINLSRNFGQHPAIFCGLEFSRGDWVVVMDGDLQDVPEEIEKLYNKALKGFPIVLGAREERKDTFTKKLGSLIFYKILNFFTGSNLSHQVGNFGVYHKDVILSVLSLGDAIKFLPTMINWVGYDKVVVPVKHAKRLEGSSSYSFGKLLSLAFDNIVSFSNKPLKIFVKFGFLLVFISVLMIVYNLYLSLSNHIVVKGYSTIIISIWFLSGCLISIMGVIGVYLGKVFDKVKARPSYIVYQKKNI